MLNRFDPLRKLMHADEAVARFGARSGTVLTHGVFDLLTRAHVAFLAEARQLGDRLVVAVHDDASARALQLVPLHPEGERAFQLAALESVDAVVSLGEPTPFALLVRLRPAVYVTRGEHALDELAETALLRSWNGHAVALPFAEGVAPSLLADHIRSALHTTLGARA